LIGDYALFSRTYNKPSGISSGGFNITPIIDIVFLLMIFFVVVSRFIEAENFEVKVPDKCDYAQKQQAHTNKITTITVMSGDNGASEYAVCAEKIKAVNYDELVSKTTDLVNMYLEKIPEESKVVTLRVDKETTFGQAQYALAAIALSNATKIKLAVFKEDN
jgi:biopolymer transport protein ExbD